MRGSALVLTLSAVLSLPACGSEDKRRLLDQPKRGGTLTVLQAGASENRTLDPAQAFPGLFTLSVYRTLYRERTGGRAPIPDLAESAPEIAADGRSLTVRLRPGVRFAPPVGREVTAADVEHAIERAFLASVGSSSALAFLGDLEGAEPGARAPAPDIPGVEATDDRTLVLRFTRPAAGAAAAALVLPLTAPVPPEVAVPLDREKVSDYGRTPVATGPYMPQANTPGRGVRLVRNPNWSAATDTRNAFVDAIEVREGYTDPTTVGRLVLDGSHRISEIAPLPPAIVRRAPSTALHIVPRAVLALALNTTRPPFDDVRVRRAVASAIDRSVFQQVSGGPRAAGLATHFLHPGVPGFDEAGGTAGPQPAHLAAPDGDVEGARRRLTEAGVDPAKTRLDVVSFQGAFEEYTDLVEAQLEEVGFKLRVVRASPEVALTKLCGRPVTRYHACLSVIESDVADAQALLSPTYEGRQIQPTFNRNVSQLADPEVDRLIAAATETAAAQARAVAWAKVDRALVDLVPAVPLLWANDQALASPDVGDLRSPLTGIADPTSMWLR